MERGVSATTSSILCCIMTQKYIKVQDVKACGHNLRFADYPPALQPVTCIVHSIGGNLESREVGCSSKAVAMKKVSLT